MYPITPSSPVGESGASRGRTAAAGGRVRLARAGAGPHEPAVRGNLAGFERVTYLRVLHSDGAVGTAECALASRR
jgi:hypothetical protein